MKPQIIDLDMNGFGRQVSLNDAENRLLANSLNKVKNFQQDW
jgi:hypothetical protein